MSRKTARLTVDHLAELADPVRSCLFWELTPVDRSRLDERERIAEKESWVSAVLRDWGSCGRVVRIDGRTVGLIVYAPAPRFPGAASLPTAPSSPDAVVAATAWIEPELRGGGLGRLLVQAMAADLVERGHTAVEAYGDTRGRPDGCVLPAEFLGSVGFKTQRAHPTTPRMRMELRTALSWKDEVELALERMWGVVRPTQKAARPIGSVRTASGDQLFRWSSNREERAAYRDLMEISIRTIAASCLSRGSCSIWSRDATRASARGCVPQMMPSSSLRSAALGLAPTMDFTTSPPW